MDTPPSTPANRRRLQLITCDGQEESISSFTPADPTRQATAEWGERMGERLHSHISFCIIVSFVSLNAVNFYKLPWTLFSLSCSQG